MSDVEGTPFDFAAGEPDVMTFLDIQLAMMRSTAEMLRELLRESIDAVRADPCPWCDPVHRWPCQTIARCDEPGCEHQATCGWPSKPKYRITCGEHMPAVTAGVWRP